MNIFDIIGPVMIGPSSSHTAGAARIGLVAREVLAERPIKADIGLFGSFALTGKGHGTDRALIAGILGMRPDDDRLRDSFAVAREKGLEFSFHEVQLTRAHPNTAVVRLAGAEGAECTVQGASVGGGNIVVTGVNGMETAFGGEAETLIIPHRDMPGVIAAVTATVADSAINIGNFRLSRPEKGYQAVMTIEVDGAVDGGLLEKLRRVPGVLSVVHVRVE